MKIAVYQFNPTIGDVQNNADKLLKAIIAARANNADLFVCPELALCGYPPEDLLFQNNFNSQISKQLQRFLNIIEITLLIPAPFYQDNKIYNSVFVIRDGKIIKRYDKQTLPNYGVFDDKRYFTSGDTTCVFECNNVKVSIVICEDMWVKQPVDSAYNDGAEFICVINASPFEEDKYERRLETAKHRVEETNLPLLYVNCIGGQDEIVYDGASFMLNANGEFCYQFEAFKEQLSYLEYINRSSNIAVLEQIEMPMRSDMSEPTNSRKGVMQQNCHLNMKEYNYPQYEERIYNALVLGVQDYVYKNGFKGVVIGLSGGIDSALTMAIAVDAVGADNVTAVMMPSQYTSEISILDSREMVKRLNITKYHEIEISSIFNQFKTSLSGTFDGLDSDITEENLQARVRGTLLMAISNKFGDLVLTTGNKSEIATGYATLYGDMAGGFAVLKDVLKTVVYKLSKWRNTVTEVIPSRIITRAPSAELRDDQTDQDSLPDYEVLDKIITYLVEDNLSVDEIIDKGLPVEAVMKTAQLLKINEYKRGQAAVGPKITKRSFGKDWRMPITHKFTY